MMINSIDLEAFLLLICGFASFNFNWWFLHRRDWRVANLMTPATCQCQKNNWYLQLPSCKKESQTVDVQDVIKVLDHEILVGGFNWNNLEPGFGIYLSDDDFFTCSLWKSMKKWWMFSRLNKDFQAKLLFQQIKYYRPASIVQFFCTWFFELYFYIPIAISKSYLLETRIYQTTRNHVESTATGRILESNLNQMGVFFLTNIFLYLHARWDFSTFVLFVAVDIF